MIMRRRATGYLVLPVLLFVTCFIYYPGLDSRFVFDDIYNLQGLGDIRDYGFLYYIFGSGFSGPSGRPLSLLSFALQYPYWPTNPFPFKLFNLLLHLLNGVMVFILSMSLGKVLATPRFRRGLFALMVTGLWLIHPVHVNTILYTVQRMTEMSAFFCLAGMVIYLHGRSCIDSRRPHPGIAWVMLSAWGLTILSILAKETGILLPVFLMIIEMVMPADRKIAAGLKIKLWIILSLPLLFFGIFLGLNHGAITAAFVLHEMTPMQRVMTEFSVIVDYMGSILLPHPSAFTLYHDGYPVSTGLLSPASTLLSLFIILTCLCIAVLVRQRYPLLAFGMLFFFAGHLLEAGPISLELYFEHRNYLPGVGVMICIAWAVTSIMENRRYQFPAMIFTGIYLSLLMAISLEETSSWKNPEVQVMEWVRTNPASDRARQELAMFHLQNGNFADAARQYSLQAGNNSNDIYADIRLLQIQVCKQKQVYSEQEMKRLEAKSGRPLKYNLATLSALDYLVLDVVSNECPGLAPGELENLIRVLINNPRSKMNTSVLYEFMSSLSVYRGDLDRAIEYIRDSLAIQFDVDRKLQEIALLDLLNRPQERRYALAELTGYLQNNPGKYLAYYKILDTLK